MLVVTLGGFQFHNDIAPQKKGPNQRQGRGEGGQPHIIWGPRPKGGPGGPLEKEKKKRKNRKKEKGKEKGRRKKGKKKNKKRKEIKEKKIGKKN